jgi:type IV pilus assembly protein PilA
MKKLFKAFKKGQKGFTLIELLVVIAIIAILAAIIVPNIGQYVNRGQTAAQKSETAMVKNAVAAIMAAAGTGTMDPDLKPATVTIDADITATNTSGDPVYIVDATNDLTLTHSVDGPFSVSEYFEEGAALANWYEVTYSGVVTFGGVGAYVAP